MKILMLSFVSVTTEEKEIISSKQLVSGFSPFFSSTFLFSEKEVIGSRDESGFEEKGEG